MTKTQSEQRRHPRQALGASFEFALPGAPAGKCRGVIADLSAGGMTFKTDAELETGMTLHLVMPGEVSIRGEVRHAAGVSGGLKRYGVRFHKISHA